MKRSRFTIYRKTLTGCTCTCTYMYIHVCMCMLCTKFGFQINTCTYMYMYAIILVMEGQHGLFQSVHKYHQHQHLQVCTETRGSIPILTCYMVQSTCSIYCTCTGTYYIYMNTCTVVVVFCPDILNQSGRGLHVCICESLMTDSTTHTEALAAATLSLTAAMPCSDSGRGVATVPGPSATPSACVYSPKWHNVYTYMYMYTHQHSMLYMVHMYIYMHMYIYSKRARFI